MGGHGDQGIRALAIILNKACQSEWETAHGSAGARHVLLPRARHAEAWALGALDARRVLEQRRHVVDGRVVQNHVALILVRRVREGDLAKVEALPQRTPLDQGGLGRRGHSRGGGGGLALPDEQLRHEAADVGHGPCPGPPLPREQAAALYRLAPVPRIGVGGRGRRRPRRPRRPDPRQQVSAAVRVRPRRRVGLVPAPALLLAHLLLPSDVVGGVVGVDQGALQFLRSAATCATFVARRLRCVVVHGRCHGRDSVGPEPPVDVPPPVRRQDSARPPKWRPEGGHCPLALVQVGCGGGVLGKGTRSGAVQLAN